MCHPNEFCRKENMQNKKNNIPSRRVKKSELATILQIITVYGVVVSMFDYHGGGLLEPPVVGEINDCHPPKEPLLYHLDVLIVLSTINS